MKKIILSALFAVILSALFSSCTLPAPTATEKPTGQDATFATLVGSWAPPNASAGTLVLEEGGTYRIVFLDETAVRGSWSADGNTVSIKANGMPAENGAYDPTKDTLTFPSENGDRVFTRIKK
ncbi:MAG: hypothetical protein RRY79_06820 [Clostridia bacterium]